MKLRNKLLFLLPSLSLIGSALGVTILIDYSKDESGFFSSNLTAKATLEQAAADLSSILASNQLTAWTQDSFSGTDSMYSAGVNFTLRPTNPSTGSQFDVNWGDINLGADEIQIFVGSQELTGNTLGQGGTASLSWSRSYTDPTTQTAVDSMKNSAEAEMLRGGGPVIYQNLNYTTNTSGVGTTLNVGMFIGSLWFDSRAGTTWNYDYATLPTTGESDFYSVALHEIMHAIGYSGHLPEGTMSPRLSDGVMQEAVIDPSLTVGTRKYLTEADADALASIGWAIVPETSTSLFILLAVFLPLQRRRR